MTDNAELANKPHQAEATPSVGQEAYRALEREQVPVPGAPAGLESVERRVPVVERGEVLADREVVGHQWQFLTEAVKRDIVDNAQIRQTLRGFIDQPVGQMMPAQMLGEVGRQDERVARLADRFQEAALILNLPEVPEAEIGQDLRNFNQLSSPAEDVGRYNVEPAQVRRRIEERAKHGAYTSGITREEADLASQRYAYSRDVKLLALGAELIDHGPVTLDDEGHATLESGLKLGIDPHQAELGARLLDPLNWQERKQRKDRVYDITVDGQAYLLKERKTNRHTDTASSGYRGHRDGQTSAGEYAIGRHMHELPPVQEGDIHVVWERPIGYAEYPDGFQFAVYHLEEGLQEEPPVRELAAAIEAQPEQFEEEYQRTNALIKAHWQDPWVVDAPNDEPALQPTGLLGRFRRAKPAPVPELRFDEFAQAKAKFLANRSTELLKETKRARGYGNSDSDGYEFRLARSSGRPRLEIIALDYEYYDVPTPAERTQQEKNRQKSYSDNPYSGLDFVTGPDRRDRAAMLAMLDQAGQLPPGVESKLPGAN